jgi:hypothetical protein
MNYKTCKTFTAQATFGLYKGYSNELLSQKVLKENLLIAQRAVKEKYGVLLSTKIRTCEIVFLGQEEPAVELKFIQYPKFQQEEELLKKAIVSLTEILLIALEQNRVVIVFSDETIMIEQNNEIDPTIKL